MTIKPEYEERRTLVIDDHEISGNYAVAALSLANSTVKWARTAAEGLELALKWLPHTIVLDLHLPDCNGLAVASQIRAGWPVDRFASIIIVLTGDGSHLERNDLAHFKIDHLLLKPVSGHQLRSVAGLSRTHVIKEPGSLEVRSELTALFTTELSQRLPEMDSGLAEIDHRKVSGILHQLIASAAICSESRIELALRTLDNMIRREEPAVDIARCYHEVLESVREFNLQGHEQ